MRRHAVQWLVRDVLEAHLMRLTTTVVVAVVVAGTAALPSVATAQPGIAIPLRPMNPAEHPDAKSEDVALALSLGGTLAGYLGVVAAVTILDDRDADAGDDEAAAQGVMITSAALAWFGPSFGHWYTGRVFTRGLGLRAAGAGTAFVGAMWAFSECGILEENCENSGGPAVVAIAGLGLWIWGTVDDITSASGAVRAYNRGLVSDVAVVPMIRGDGGSVALTGRF